jgi:excisionase family DNA binding protein
MALSAEEAAYVLGCSVPQVWNLLRVEALPRTRIGRQTRISRTAIQEFISAGGVAVVTTRDNRGSSSAKTQATGSR